MRKAVKPVYAGLFVAFGLILPQIFHFFGGTGPMFLPMHIPVLLAGFYLDAPFGLLVGLATPVLSSLATGMPALPILYFMIFELMTYGFLAGYFFKTRKLNAWISLILAMIGGRMILSSAVYGLQILLGLKLSPMAYITSALTSGVPGMVIQLLVIPIIIKATEKAGVSIARTHA